MPDLHDSLDDEARRVRSEPGALGGVLDRANRRRRTRRIASGVLALAVAAGGIGLAFAAFRSTDQLQPGAGPVPGPTPSVSPRQQQIEGLHIGDRSSYEGAGEFARALLAGVLDSVPMLLPEGDNERTTIHCHPNREADAIWLRDRFFPGAELRPRIDEETILVIVGDDFVRRHQQLFELFASVRSFMTRRVEGSGAEDFLSPAAAERFADEASGLSLYGYTRGGSFQIVGLHPRDDGSAIVYLLIVTPEGGDYVASERLTVGDLDPADGRADILDAEQVSPPEPMFEQIRIFVRQFLRARRQASGAGTFLGEDARAAYASGEGGLDLLGYAETAERAHIEGLDKLSAERTRVRVRFGLQDQEVFEELTVERLGQTMFVIADAERVG